MHSQIYVLYDPGYIKNLEPVSFCGDYLYQSLFLCMHQNMHAKVNGGKVETLAYAEQILEMISLLCVTPVPS